MAGLLEPESPEKFGLKDKHVLLVLGTAKKKAFRGTHRILARIPTKVIYVRPCTVYSVASVCLQLDVVVQKTAAKSKCHMPELAVAAVRKNRFALHLEFV